MILCTNCIARIKKALCFVSFRFFSFVRCCSQSGLFLWQWRRCNVNQRVNEKRIDYKVKDPFTSKMILHKSAHIVRTVQPDKIILKAKRKEFGTKKSTKGMKLRDAPKSGYLYLLSRGGGGGRYRVHVAQ